MNRIPTGILFITLLLNACGNYSLLEKIGPDGDDSYFQFSAGRYWVYKGTYKAPHQDPIPVFHTNIMTSSSLFTNSLHFVYTNGNTSDKGSYAFKPHPYGYDQVLNILAGFPIGTWGTVATPQTITVPYLRMPFIEGIEINDIQTQVITNYPLSLSSIPATVLLTYTTHNKVLKNNLTVEINGTEYEKCVKYSHSLTITIASAGDNAPYSDGDIIQTTEDVYTLHLAPGFGIISMEHSSMELGQDNIYKETLFEGSLFESGSLF